MLATWESAIGMHLLDLRIAPNFPPPIVLPTASKEARPEAHSTVLGSHPSPQSHASTSTKPTPSPGPGQPTPGLPAEASALAISPSQPNPEVVFGAPYHSQPYAHVTPHLLTCRPSQEDVPLPDRYAVFMALRQFGPLRTLAVSFEGAGGEVNTEGGSGALETKKREAGGIDDDSSGDDDGREWTVEVNYWFEEDADRLQRDWDGMLCGWRA